jgi:DNA-binding CsgD family transcriptional regulator/PAS domain-containing protein
MGGPQRKVAALKFEAGGAMATSLQEELTDAVFRAALEPDAWSEVMRLMQMRFPSEAQTFYFLHREPRRVQPVCLRGVGRRWLESFDAFYFAPDNPWIRLTQRLHRPGIVRTNERLEELLGDPKALYRSAYYNDWMRPQGFKYSIGNTLLSDETMVANVTLLRAPDMPTFDDAEVRAFEALSRQLARSLQISVRLEQAEARRTGSDRLDAFPQAVALVDARMHVHYANGAMEALLRARGGLSLCEGKLRASTSRAQQRLSACIATAFVSGADDTPSSAPLVLQCDERKRLTIYVTRAAGGVGKYAGAGPLAFLMVLDTTKRQPVSSDALRALYGFTESEARLARCIVEGNDLRLAAGAVGVTYGTARGYLKVIFDKLTVHTQAQLVGRILGDTST